jgi:hypothetical protein
MSAINVKSASAVELLAFYNAHSGREAVKRFADRRSAEKRVSILLAERQFNVPTPLPEVDAEDARYITDYGVAYCPSCRIHLSNGVGHHMQDVNGKPVRHSKFQFECLGCCEEFGPLIGRSVNGRPVTSMGPRPAMVESLKLDRRIMHVDTNVVYANANRVFKAGLVSSAQGDRLSATLYRAAKVGNRQEHVVINNLTFRLADAV